jgi:hypothetical protein
MAFDHADGDFFRLRGKVQEIEACISRVESGVLRGDLVVSADVLRTAADGCEMLASDIAAVVRKMAKS